MMRISRTIGVCLLILSVAVVAVALREKIQMGKAYRSAVEDVLLTLHGGDVGNSSVLTVSYRFAHGIEVVNGEQIRATDAGRADVKIVQGDMTAFLIFKEGATGRAPCKRDEAAAVRIVRPFLGDMSFKASVCGCEMMAPLIALILASALAVVMTGIGLFLLFRKGAGSAVNAQSIVSESEVREERQCQTNRPNQQSNA